MDKVIVEFEWYRVYNPLDWNIFVVDEDINDVVFLKRRRLPKSTVYPSKEFYIKMIEDGKSNKRNR